MATCIIFYHHACCPDRLLLQIREEVRDNLVCLLDLRKESRPDIGLYRHVLIGIPYHKGKIPARIIRFCQENQDILAMKKVGLFLCSPESRESAMSAIETLLPAKILKQARSTQYFPVPEPKAFSWKNYFHGKSDPGNAHLIPGLYDHAHIRQFARSVLMLVP